MAEPSIPNRERSHWAWGFADEVLAGEELRALARVLADHLGFGEATVLEEPVPLDAISLPAPALQPPAALAAICSADAADRARHAHGQSYQDLISAFRGRLEHVPDFVAWPASETDIADLLAWCESEGAALIPYGGGTSVTGGVTPEVGDGYSGTVCLDMTRLDRVLAVDEVSGAALIQAGAAGPVINEQLARSGWTLRHFPQSWEFSTLGGWIATRAGGHYATLHTHIDDFVESVRAITPRGVWESRRLPGSGAGISPDRMLLGSEGILGVITQAWVRIQRPPFYRASVTVRLPSFAEGAEVVRQIVASGLYPAACRLLDPAEAALAGGGDGRHAHLVLGFESADHPVRPLLDAALAIAGAGGGSWDEVKDRAGDRQARQWRDTFLRMPYLRNAYPAMGIIAETFETAITWDKFAGFHEAVYGAALQAAQAECGQAKVTCRLAFAYPDGAAPYYTVLGAARRGAEVAQWGAIKQAASDAILAAGGTITHHHAVGRDHRPWYDRQRPDPFALALRGAKSALDPAGVLNPGVLVGGPADQVVRPS
ncbi:MAG TPA: FAD-binding oxidoreductase [Streptosporangiaceae bacterium]|nr:FAD-binding oxidoreductase [Streptosporangiaceae bacterium]